jgi:hypothetical protein
MKPYQGKHKESLEKRSKLMDLLKPYGISVYQLKSLHNPAKGKMTMRFYQDASSESHVVPFYVSYDKTKVFKYKGRLYDASKMTVAKRSQIMRMMK